MARMLTDADLEAIEAGAEAALPGPWESFVEDRDHIAGSDFIRTGGLDDSAPDLYLTRSSADWTGVAPVDAPTLDFVPASRKDVLPSYRRHRAEHGHGPGCGTLRCHQHQRDECGSPTVPV